MAALLHPMQFIPKLTPKYTEPQHLAPFVDLFVRIHRGEQVRAVVSVPPGHEKTETLSHCVVWLMKQRPAMRACYATYGQRLSAKKSRRIRQLAERAHVPLDRNSASTSDWRTGIEEGGMWSTSVGGAVVGERFDFIALDDLVKDRLAAESALARERTYEWTIELEGRAEPSASMILIMHPWHVDDVGRRLVRDGWEDVSLPALNEKGEALCPERFSVEKLAKIRERIGEYAWPSLYMCRPVARGGAVFRDVHTYDKLPEGVRLVVVIGADFAYSTKTHADYSVAVVLATDGTVFYVVDVVRLQVTAPTFQAELMRLRRERGDAEIVAYISGTEKGTIDMMVSQGTPITAQPAIGDKFTRSQPVAAAWAAGTVLIPSYRTPWRDAFISEVCGFTGIADKRDDQVDALAAAYDAAKAASGSSMTDEERRWLLAANARLNAGGRWAGSPGRGYG